MNKLKYYSPIIFFFLSSFIPFYWLRGYFIGYGDAGFIASFYNSNYLLDIYKYTWESQFLTGTFSGMTITLLPFSGFFNLLAFFGLNNYLQQAFVYFMILFLSMLFMYLFVYELFDYRTDKKLIATLSAIFYVFNPLSMISYWYRGILSLYLIPFIPLVLFFFLLTMKKQKLIYIFLLSIIFSVLSIVFLNPAFVIPVIILLVLFFIYQLVLDWKNKYPLKKIFSSIIVLIFLSFLINAWFLLPLTQDINDYFTVQITIIDIFQYLIDNSRAVSLTTFFRLIPIKLDSEIWAYKDPTWRYLYNSDFFILLGFFITLLILVPLLLRKKDKNILFFALLLLIGVFLSLGLNPPFGFAFNFMYTNIPYFNIFRNPYDKFMPFLVVSFTILFGVGVSSLHNWINRRSKGCANTVLIIILFLTIGVYSFPMWTGSVVNTPVVIRGNEISSFVEVPLYYENISKYFSNDLTDYRILSLPLRPIGYVGFNWTYGYDGPDATWLLYKHKAISDLAYNYYPSARILSKHEKQNFTNLYKITKFFGIKYVVIQNDVDIIHGNYKGDKLTAQRELKSLLDQLNVSLIRSFGELDLYKIPNEHYLPHIYPSAVPILINGDIDEMFTLVTSDNFSIDRKILFLRNQTNKSQWEFLEKYRNIEDNHAQSITFQRINPTKYEVKVENATKPFFLVFSESYHPKWKAYVEKDHIKFNGIIAEYNNPIVKEAKHEMSFTPNDVFYVFKKPINEDLHFIVNGYANAWYIDPKDVGKDNFTITLYFWPQSLFYLGMIISGITLFGFIGYVVYDVRKKILSFLQNLKKYIVL